MREQRGLAGFFAPEIDRNEPWQESSPILAQARDSRRRSGEKRPRRRYFQLRTNGTLILPIRHSARKFWSSVRANSDILEINRIRSMFFIRHGVPKANSICHECGTTGHGSNLN